MLSGPNALLILPFSEPFLLFLLASSQSIHLPLHLFSLVFWTFCPFSFFFFSSGDCKIQSRVKTCVSSPSPPDHRGWLDLSQWVHGRRRRRRVVRSGIHSAVPGAVQQLVHLAVGQCCQREVPVQMIHVQGSPEKSNIVVWLLY